MPTVYREQKANGGLIRWSRGTVPFSEWIVGYSYKAQIDPVAPVTS